MPGCLCGVCGLAARELGNYKSQSGKGRGLSDYYSSSSRPLFCFAFLDYRTAVLMRRWRAAGTKQRNASCRGISLSGQLELSNLWRPRSTIGSFSCFGRHCAFQKVLKLSVFRVLHLLFCCLFLSSLGVLHLIFVFYCFETLISEHNHFWFGWMPHELEQGQLCW